MQVTERSHIAARPLKRAANCRDLYNIVLRFSSGHENSWSLSSVLVTPWAWAFASCLSRYFKALSSDTAGVFHLAPPLLHPLGHTE